MENHNMHTSPDLDGPRRFTIKDHGAQDARMALYAKVAGLASAAMPPEVAAAIGPLAIAPRLYDDSQLTLPQFRSGPLDVLAGAELRFHHLHDGGGDDYADGLLDWLLGQAEAFSKDPGHAGGYVEDARAAAMEAIGRDATVHPPAALSTMGFLVGRVPGTAPSDVVIELEMLGPGLTPAVERLFATSAGDLQLKLAKELATHRRRTDLLAQFRADRQRGLADETTLRILSHVGMELGFVLEYLSRLRELVFDFADGLYRASISWDEGVLVTDFWTNDPGFHLRGGEFHLGRRVPETLLTGSIGRRLGPLVDQRHISGDAVITDAYADHGGNAVVSLAVPRQPIPWPLIQ